MSGMHEKARKVVADRLRKSNMGARFHDTPTGDGVRCTLVVTCRDVKLTATVSVQSPGDSGIVDMRAAAGSLECVSARLGAIALAVSGGWDAHRLVTYRKGGEK